MDELEELQRKIDLLRADMELEIEKGDLLSYDALNKSQKLDEALNVFNKMTKKDILV